jgi:uncharacterized Zn finger protein
MTPEEKAAVIAKMQEKYILEMCPDCKNNVFEVLGRSSINPDGLGLITTVLIECEYCGFVSENIESVLMA